MNILKRDFNTVSKFFAGVSACRRYRFASAVLQMKKSIYELETWIARHLGNPAGSLGTASRFIHISSQEISNMGNLSPWSHDYFIISNTVGLGSFKNIVVED